MRVTCFVKCDLKEKKISVWWRALDEQRCQEDSPFSGKLDLLFQVDMLFFNYCIWIVRLWEYSRVNMCALLSISA